MTTDPQWRLFVVFAFIMWLSVLILTMFFMTSCNWRLIVDPQAAIDNIDSLRERNERGIYHEVIEDIEDLAPGCYPELGPDDYPTTFAVLGLDYAHYHPGSNAVIYPLGDHKRLRHEMTHAVTVRGNLSNKCMHEIIAGAMTDIDNVRSSSLRR